MCCLVGVHLQQSLHVVANINVCLVNAGKHITTSGTVVLLCNTSKQVTLELLLSDYNLKQSHGHLCGLEVVPCCVLGRTLTRLSTCY